MTQLSSSQEAILRNVYEYAADLMREGLSAKDIQQNLMAHGLDHDAAANVVENLGRIKGEAIRKAGLKSMAIGAVVCLIGAVVTLAGYTAASESPAGGSYVVAWGAVVFGALQFLRGLYQWITNLAR